ncbi:MAG: hypothetical protein HY423_11590 [Candidatus Lambdaproteobacteria bacterium]|nr:hypothetical protein [Candidatus Lambdaproteobacteria bacterium]
MDVLKRRIAFPIALLALAACLAGTPAEAQQQGGAQLVDSAEVYQRRIEALVAERLSALFPSQSFVLRAFVVGERTRVPVVAAAPGVFELPGFRRTQGEQPRSEEKFRVDQVVVRVVLHEDVAPADLQYIRTVVPLLADFRAERGDRLDVQVVAPKPPPAPPAAGVAPEAAKAEAAAPEAAQPEAKEPAVKPGEGMAKPPVPPEPQGFTVRDWIVLGLLGLMLLVLLIVLLRVFLMRLQPAQPAVAPPLPALAHPPPPVRRPEDEKREQELAQAREQQERIDSLRATVVKGLFARSDIGRQLVVAWQSEGDKLAALIHCLGPTVARQALLPHLDRERYRSLEEQVAQEERPSNADLIEVLREANLFLLAREITEPERFSEDPFPFLRELSRGQIAHLIKEEPVRVKAIVLSRIDPDDTAAIMDQMPRELQLEVAVQIGNLQSLPLDMLSDVAKALADKSRHLPDAKSVDIEGPRALVDVMGRAAPETSRYLLQAMKTKDRRLSEVVEKRFFMFEFIPEVAEELLPQAVRAVASTTVIQALQGAEPELQRKVILAFPEQARTGLVTSLRSAKYDRQTILEARRQVVARFQQLAEQGKIDLKQISDAWQAQQTKAAS